MADMLTDDRDQVYADRLAILGLVQQVAERRRALGLSAHQVVHRLGYTGQTAIVDLESGRSEVRLSKLMRYARAVGLKVTVTIEEATDG